MRFFKALPLTAALASAFVLPDEQVMNQIAIEDRRHDGLFSNVKNAVSDTVDTTKDAIDNAFDDAATAFNSAYDNARDYAEDKTDEAESWFNEFRHAREQEFEDLKEEVSEDAMRKHWNDMETTARGWADDLGAEYHCEHNMPPLRGGPDKYRRPLGDDLRDPFPPSPPDSFHDEHHGHRPPHKGPHHHEPNQTVYQLISSSKYTTKLTKLVNQFPDVVAMLNGTKSNFTIFAPTDKAFEKIPEHGRHPSKEILLKILQYHVVPDVYPASRVLGSRTLPTVLEGTGLSVVPKDTPQRLSINLSLKGLTLNFYSRVVAINIVGTNGIVHGIDSLLVPPPKAAQVISFLPSEFSTLELGLYKTGLYEVVNDTSNHLGGTLFAPGNNAWQKLGPGATAFLFSKHGQKYLKAVLKYHISPNTTLYSDALYVVGKCKEDISTERTFHIDLPTLLKDKSLSVDIGHIGRLYDIRINGFSHVRASDGIVKDGVIHLVGDVLIPPRTPGGHAEILDGEIAVDDLIERLEPYVDEEPEDSVYDELSYEL